MSQIEAVRSCFKKYACFSGRARRSEYWNWFMFNLFVSFVITFAISLSTKRGGTSPLSLLLVIYTLAVFLPSLAVSVRRLHDIGRSGRALLFGLIPIAGVIMLIVFYCKDSQPGDNKYGSNPKYDHFSKEMQTRDYKNYTLYGCPNDSALDGVTLRKATEVVHYVKQ